MIDKKICQAHVRQMFQCQTVEFDKEIGKLRLIFPSLNQDNIRAISSEAVDALHQDTVVTAVLSLVPNYLDDGRTALCSRKYFLQHGWIYDKIYRLPNLREKFALPEGAVHLATGNMVSVRGQPGAEDFSQLKSVYFYHQDHERVEEWAGFKIESGRYSTFYSALFLKDSVAPVEVSAHVYDDQGVFSDWDVLSDTRAKYEAKMTQASDVVV